jgi:hypothetical protein
MSKGRWRYPTPAEIKRAIKANLDLGLTVTDVCVDERSITVSTQPATQPSTKVLDAQPTENSGPLEL